MLVAIDLRASPRSGGTHRALVEFSLVLLLFLWRSFYEMFSAANFL